MKINDRNIEPIRPTRPASEGREPSKDVTARTQPVENTRSDRLELSDAARNLAKQAVHVLRERTPHIQPVDQQKSGEEQAPGILPTDKPKDEAHFSVAARQLAKEVLQALPTDAANRLHQVRQRVLNGAYDIDHVVSEVARRIIDRGDL
jgi:anti-sigma28 factor (negative regulator of flagellin synthesis)